MLTRRDDAELLRAAADKNGAETVRELLSRRANPNAQNTLGQTPLALALQQDAPQVCKLLLVYQTARLEPVQGSGEAARLAAAWFRGEESLIMAILKELLAQAAGVHDVTLLEVAFATLDITGLDADKAAQQLDTDNNSLLHLCAAHRVVDEPGTASARLTMQSLLRRGLAADCMNTALETPLLLVVRGLGDCKCMEASLELARLLLEASASANSADHGGVAPLMWAARRSSLEMCKLLLEHGANPLQPDLQKETALNLSASCGEVNALLHSALSTNGEQEETLPEELGYEKICPDRTRDAEKEIRLEHEQIPTFITTHLQKDIHPRRSNSVIFELSSEDEVASVQGLCNQMDLEESYDLDWKSHDGDWSIHTNPTDGVHFETEHILPAESQASELSLHGHLQTPS